MLLNIDFRALESIVDIYQNTYWDFCCYQGQGHKMADISLNINFRAQEAIVAIYVNIYMNSYRDLEFDL